MADTEPRLTRAEAKADAAAAKARSKSMRPWYRKKRFIIPAVIVAIIVIASVASGGSKSKSKVTAPAGVNSISAAGSSPAAADVTIDSCDPDALGDLAPHLTIVNHSSKTSNYLIQLNVVDAANTKVGEADATSSNVEAGQTAKVDGFSTVKAAQGLKCQVKSVLRTAS